MTNPSPSTTTIHAQPALASRIGDAVWRAWRGFWIWRAKQATVQILRSLDARTLNDIGLCSSEIESTVYGKPGERRRDYHERWRVRWGS